MAFTFGRFFGVFIVVLLIVFFVVGVGSNRVFAGFGITPPYIENNRLTRGSVYEQRITLVRSNPEEDLQARITMNVSEIEDWISIDKGEEFILPEGVRQVPIIFTVRVPEDASYERHQGSIRVRTSSLESPEGGGVSIALGAQIDVDIEVVDKILDFNVRRVRVANLEEGRRKWGLFFPGKIRFFMTIENTGNTNYGPTGVRIEIFDRNMETLLETTENTNKIEYIEPFAIQEVMAELPTRLPTGSYIAKYTIYNGDEIAQQNTTNLRVADLGAVSGYEGYGFAGLAFADKLKVGGVTAVPALILLLSIALLIRRKNKKNRRRLPTEKKPVAFS